MAGNLANGRPTEAAAGPKIAEQPLDAGVRVIGLALIGPALGVLGGLVANAHQVGPPALLGFRVAGQRGRRVAAGADVEEEAADRAEVVREEPAIGGVEAQDPPLPAALPQPAPPRGQAARGSLPR